MEVCDAIVMLFDVTPDCHAVSVIAVKRPVHKLDLRHFMIQEKLQELGFLAKLQDYEPVDFWSEKTE